MPWTPKQFRDRHNKKLPLPAAKAAAARATAMIQHGVSEGVAIAVANKHAMKGYGAVVGKRK